jgi:hypothetical protein
LDNSEDNRINSEVKKYATDLSEAIDKFKSDLGLDKDVRFLERLSVNSGLASKATKLSGIRSGKKELPASWLTEFKRLTEQYRNTDYLYKAAVGYKDAWNRAAFDVKGKPTKERSALLRECLKDSYCLGDIKIYQKKFNDEDLLAPIAAIVYSVPKLKLCSEHETEDLDWLQKFKDDLLFKFGQPEKIINLSAGGDFFKSVFSDIALLDDLLVFIDTFLVQWGCDSQGLFVDMIDPLADTTCRNSLSIKLSSN